MLTEIYIEALLVDEDLADQVWEAWDRGDISTYWAAWMWWMIADRPFRPLKQPVVSIG
jgi:hypothetical protein